MARTRVVTRTIEVTEVQAMVVNTDTKEVTTCTYEVGKTDRDLLKTVKELYETETDKIVTITGTSIRQDIYGMLETDFIRLARKMDSDRHFVGDDTEIEVED